jgi:hypothetical protein
MSQLQILLAMNHIALIFCIEGCQKIIPKARAEFLNVTLRYVLKDDVSVLSYAKTNRISAVLSFSQAMTVEGEADMRQLTEALVDLAASNGGSFYLPYRLHARPEQVARIYPKFNHFIEPLLQLCYYAIFYANLHAAKMQQQVFCFLLQIHTPFACSFYPQSLPNHIVQR